FHVTGVQTCALPIFASSAPRSPASSAEPAASSPDTGTGRGRRGAMLLAVSAPAATPETLARTHAGDGAFTPSDWLVFATVSGIWGASFLFIAIGLDSLEPGVITLMRVGLGAATLALMPGKVRIERADRPRLVAVSVLWVA